MEECYAGTQSEESVNDNTAAGRPISAQEKLTERTLTEDEFIHIFSQWLEPWIMMYNSDDCESDTAVESQES